jgi:hypothetical protein
MADSIEDQIGAALKPQTGENFGKRPRVFPVPESEPVKKPEPEGFEPVRTLTQFLTDIESIAVRIDGRLTEQNAHLAEILNGINERLGRIENSIGVR